MTVFCDWHFQSQKGTFIVIQNLFAKFTEPQTDHFGDHRLYKTVESDPFEFSPKTETLSKLRNFPENRSVLFPKTYKFWITHDESSL
jgi:hypothetical protein